MQLSIFFFLNLTHKVHINNISVQWTYNEIVKEEEKIRTFVWNETIKKKNMHEQVK